MRIGYLGPEGTFSGEALRASIAPAEHEAVALPTIHDTVMAVQERLVERAIVPIENSIEGSVDQTLDALALDAPDVQIVGEAVHPVHHCLIALRRFAAEQIRVIVSHPQVIGQCARFIRGLPQARVEMAPSTAEAVRSVAERPADDGRAALGNRLSAELYGCLILRERVEDHEDNQTRFVWLSSGPPPARATDATGRSKTSLLFWGTGASGPGWLVACLSEFASHGVNLTRIESRPQGRALGSYMFFADVEGHVNDAPVAEGITGLRRYCDDVRVLGSYPAA